MRKILVVVVALSILSASCFKRDNYVAPNAVIHGNIIDSYTGEKILTSQNDWSIRIWERSWKETTPIQQSIPVKQDGTYKNSKLFSGTYDMLPYGGPFWPEDTVRNVSFNSSGDPQDFTVTPYLQLVDFDYSLEGTKLFLTCRLVAPKRDGLPNIVEIKPFISLTKFCGESSYINIPEYNDKRIQINKSWEEEVGDTAESGVYKIGPLEVKAGYTYNVRLGANVNDAYRKYNYTEIKQVVVSGE